MNQGLLLLNVQNVFVCTHRSSQNIMYDVTVSESPCRSGVAASKISSLRSQSRLAGSALTPLSISPTSLRAHLRSENPSR